MKRWRKLALVALLAATSAFACHGLAGLEEPTDDGVAPDSAIDPNAQVPLPEHKCVRADGEKCFCQTLVNPASAAVLKCVDFDDESAAQPNFGLEQGLISALPLFTFSLDEAASRSQPFSLRVAVKTGEGIAIDEVGVVAKDAPPTQTSVQFSIAYGKPDAGPSADDTGDNRTKLLLILKVDSKATRTVVLGVDYGAYLFSVAQDITTDASTRQVQEAGLALQGAVREPLNGGYRTFALSVEEKDPCSGDAPGLTAVLRVASPLVDPTSPGNVQGCRPLGDVEVGPNTEVYFGGYIKNPYEPLEWRFDNIVIRKRPWK